MILITGATGHLGSATIDFLRNKQPGLALAALVRDPAKASALQAQGIELRQGNYFDYPSLLAAMKGIETLLLISSNDMNERGQQHINAIRAAKEAGVKHILYTSMIRPSMDNIFMAGPSHYETEQALIASGLTYTILRNSLYFEILPMVLNVEQAVASGGIYFPAGEGRITFGARKDMAEALAAVLLNLGVHANKTYDIGVNDAYSFHDMASVLSQLSGKTISYYPISEEALVEELKKHNLPQEAIGMATMMAASFKANEFNGPASSLEQLIGHKPLDLQGFLKANFFA